MGWFTSLVPNPYIQVFNSHSEGMFQFFLYMLI